MLSGLVPANSPDRFVKDTPAAVLVRHFLGAIAEFERATTVLGGTSRSSQRYR